jgi:hypothetical protein
MQWNSSTPPFPQPMKKWSIMKTEKYPFMFFIFEYLQPKNFNYEYKKPQRLQFLLLAITKRCDKELSKLQTRCKPMLGGSQMPIQFIN